MADQAQQPAPANLVRGRHLPALDGLRAVAILAVMAFHLGKPSLPGGYLGVDLFFVLSGFLITSLLLEERSGHGHVNLGAFYLRRAKRLLPGLYVMLVATVLTTVAFGQLAPQLSPAQSLHQLRWDAITTVAYCANWFFIAHSASREAVRALEQVWSLSIEEQFYLLWPAAVIALAALRGGWRRAGLAASALGVVASGAYMAWLAGQPQGRMHAYLNTFSRASDLLVGATLAFAMAAASPLAPAIQRVARRGAPWAALTIGAFLFVGETGGIVAWPRPFMYRGGFLVVALLTAVLIADATAERPSLVGRSLSNRGIVAIGLISYGLYLYHWPVNFFVGPRLLPEGSLQLAAARTALAFVLAILSYRYVEQPLRRARYLGWRKAAWPLATALVVGVAIVGTIPSVGAPVGAPVPTAAPRGPVRPASAAVLEGLGTSLPTPSVGGPVVRLIGDRGMRQLAPPLQAALRSAGASVDSSATDGWGLASANGLPRSDGDAAKNISLTMLGIAEAKAQLVLLSVSSADQGELLARPDRVRRNLDQLAAAIAGQPQGATLLVLGQPEPTRSASEGAKEAWRRFTAMAKAEAMLHRGHVAYLPAGRTLTLDGSPATWLPPLNAAGAPRSSWVRVRSTDSVGICQPGAVAMVQATLQALRPSLTRSPSGSWWRGSWTTKAGYDGPGRCLNDHP